MKNNIVNRKTNNGLHSGVTTDSFKENLSAFADDEYAVDRDIVEFACNDAEARTTWQCVHLMRDVMQADYHSALDVGFAARLAQKIELEESVHQSTVVSISSAADAKRAKSTSDRNQQKPFALWKPVAGLGLAASLAGAAFLVPQLLESTSPGNQQQLAQVPTTERAINGLQSGAQTVAFNRVNDAGTRWRSDSELPRNQQVEQRLNAMLTNHLEDASMGRVHGMLAHSRVVSYDSLSFRNKGF